MQRFNCLFKYCYSTCTNQSCCSLKWQDLKPCVSAYVNETTEMRCLKHLNYTNHNMWIILARWHNAFGMQLTEYFIYLWKCQQFCLVCLCFKSRKQLQLFMSVEVYQSENLDQLEISLSKIYVTLINNTLIILAW